MEKITKKSYFRMNIHECYRHRKCPSFQHSCCQFRKEVNKMQETVSTKGPMTKKKKALKKSN